MFNDDIFVYGDQNVQVPAHLNFEKFILDRIHLKKDEIALENGETREKLTHKEFTQYAVNISTALSKLGVGRGDIVTVGSEKRNEFVPTILAIVFTGATYTPYDLKSGRAGLKHKISITQPKYFICSNHFWSRYGDILKNFDCIKKFITLDDSVESAISIKALVTNDVDINRFEPMQVHGQIDAVFILYSSGTTGMPKGVQLTHLNCILNSLPDKFTDASLAFLCGEWYHNYNTFMTYKFLALGRKFVYNNEATPNTFMKSVEDCDVCVILNIEDKDSQYCIFSTLLCLLLIKSETADKFNLDSLKIIYSGSSPLHNKTIEKVKSRFPKLKNILQGYGRTEAGELTSESWGTKGPKPGSVGMACPGITLKIGPLELETILQLHPGVLEAGVVGKPVPDYGEEPTAFVVKQPGTDVTENDLMNYVSLEVGPYMILRGGVKFIQEMPSNPRGKILRQKLREILNENV